MNVLKRSLGYFLIALIVSSITSCKKETSDGPVIVPSVSTSAVSSITSSSATSGGSILDDGGSTISERGICYSTSPTPTRSNSIVKSGSGKGSFSSDLIGLAPNTTYYVRAYAINSAGTGYGNNEIVFNTSLSAPTLTTSAAASITGNGAVCGGQVMSNGGASIITRGICYGINSNPTIVDSTVISLGGTNTFTVSLTGLAGNTTYYARAFATTASGTGYGAEVTFTTLAQVIAIGSTYNGGIVFYIDDTGLHGLIAAPTDQSTSADWGCYGTAITGADGFTVGDGVQNTMDITTGCSSSVNAAALCSDLTIGGYSDWYLPSKMDMDQMYANLYLNSQGSFSTITYWSSTEVNANNAASFNFNTNTHSNSNKNSPYAVRAIRSF